MVAKQHPEELNPLQRYRQASSILRGTSRATNDGWYASPLDLDVQLHIRIDGEQVSSHIFYSSSGEWKPGPTISEELFRDPAKVSPVAEQLISLAKKAGSSAVGVVLHVADEFATTEIKPELDNPGALSELGAAIVNEPATVLDDASLSADDHSWRLLPYPATGSSAIATAVTLSKQAEPAIEAFREYGIAHNFPIITLSLSAPLTALLSLPRLRPEVNQGDFIAVLTYSVFTVLAFFNEHGDLRLIRTLQHRGQRRPSNLRHAASTTAVALEMATPDVLVLPLSAQFDPQIIEDLNLVFEGSQTTTVDWQSAGLSAPGGDVAPEPVISTKIAEEVDTPLAASHTFTTLSTDGWATQDFLPVSPNLAAIYPSRGEMKLIRASRQVRWGLVAAILLSFGWIALQLLEIVRQPEWTFNNEEAKALSSRLAALGHERKKVDHWDNLLDDRSKGWASMEMLVRFFPERSGFLVKTFQHSVNPESAPGQAKVAFVKQWRINGLAREEALEKLADLNTREGISAAFAEIARVTGNQSFRTDLNSRSLVVNIKTLENASYKPMPPDEITMDNEETYPFLFDLTITQRFESDDPLAITSYAAP